MEFSEAQKIILKAAEEFHYNRGMTVSDLCIRSFKGLTGDPETTLLELKELESLGYLYRGNPRPWQGEGEYSFPWFITQKGHELVTSGSL